MSAFASALLAEWNANKHKVRGMWSHLSPEEQVGALLSGKYPSTVAFAFEQAAREEANEQFHGYWAAVARLLAVVGPA